MNESKNPGSTQYTARALLAVLASATFLVGATDRAAALQPAEQAAQQAAAESLEAASQVSDFEIMGLYTWEEEAILGDGMEWQVQYETQIFGDVAGGTGTILLGNGTEFHIEGLRKTQAGNYVLTTDCMKSYIAEANEIAPGCLTVNMMLIPEGDPHLYEGEFMGNVGNVLVTFALEVYIYEY